MVRAGGMFGEPLDIGIGNLILHLQGTDQKLAGLKINFCYRILMIAFYTKIHL